MLEEAILMAQSVLEMQNQTSDTVCTAQLIIARCHARLKNKEKAQSAYNMIINREGHDARAIRAIAERELAEIC